MKSKYFLDNAVPKEIVYTLLSIDNEEILTKDNFEQKFKANNWVYGTRYHDNFRRLVDLGILKKIKKNEYYLSRLGQKMKSILLVNQDTFFEIFHYLQYARSSSCKGREYFWTYKAICDMFYNELKIPSGSTSISSIINALQNKFKIQKIAIDSRSIGKTVVWLKALGSNSPIINNKTYQPRSHLNYPEVILLSVNYLYKIKNLNFGFPIMLDEFTRKTICQFCLLSCSSMEKYLEILITNGLIRKNVGVGGTAIILDNEVDISDWLEAHLL